MHLAAEILAEDELKALPYNPHSKRNSTISQHHGSVQQATTRMPNNKHCLAIATEENNTGRSKAINVQHHTRRQTDLPLYQTSIPFILGELDLSWMDIHVHNMYMYLQLHLDQPLHYC